MLHHKTKTPMSHWKLTNHEEEEEEEKSNF